MDKLLRLADTLNRIDALKGAKNPDKSIFKGTSTRSPNHRAVTMAKAAVKALDEMELHPDQIEAAPDGGVLFKWNGAKKTGTLDFYNTTECFGTVIDEKGFREVWEVAPNHEGVKRALKYIREFVGRNQAA